MNNFPGKRFESFVYWIGCKWGVSPSGIARRCSQAAVFLCCSSILTQIAIFSFESELLIIHLTNIFVFFCSLIIALSIIKDREMVLMLNCMFIGCTVGFIAIESLLADIGTKKDLMPIITIMLAIISYAAKTQFAEVEQKDRDVMELGHLPQERPPVKLHFLTCSFLFVLSCLGAYLKYKVAYKLWFPWSMISVALLFLSIAFAVGSCIPRPPTRSKQKQGFWLGILSPST